MKKYRTNYYMSSIDCMHSRIARDQIYVDEHRYTSISSLILGERVESELRLVLKIDGRDGQDVRANLRLVIR